MTPRIAHCRSCDDSIVWMKTSTGKKIPVNTDGVDERTLEWVFDPQERSNDGRIPKFDPRQHTAHFATCKHADQHRRR